MPRFVCGKMQLPLGKRTKISFFLSMLDLFAFTRESLVRALFACVPGLMHLGIRTRNDLTFTRSRHSVVMVIVEFSLTATSS